MQTILSPDRKYRYRLYRDATVWDRSLLPTIAPAPVYKDSALMFIGLNPSTADEKVDDQTIRICRGYAKTWGYRWLCMTNLFAWRETNATALFLQPDPIGPENDVHLMECAAQAGCIIAAWGSWSTGARVRDVLDLLSNYDIHVLKLNDNGTPHHPLRMAKVHRPLLWIKAHASAPR